MSELTVIRALPHQHEGSDCLTQVPLSVDRMTLAKRRWRGTAADGREFGFDLDQAMWHRHYFFYEGDTSYYLDQAPEEVLEIAVPSPEQAARVAWNIGNLHFGVDVRPDVLRVTPDSAVVQFLEREHIHFDRVTCVFQPLSAASHHHYDHGHGHHHHD